MTSAHDKRLLQAEDPRQSGGGRRQIDERGVCHDDRSRGESRAISE